MKLKNKLFTAAIITLVSATTFAETCQPRYQSLPFYLVKIGYGRVACYYGDARKHDNIFYEKLGEFHPVSGPWIGDGNPDIVGCPSEDSSICVFE